MILDNNIIDNFRDLLYNFWIVKDGNEEIYYKIKYNQNKIKDFVSKNLGSNLIIHNRFIKLEKIPSYLVASEGINTFNNVEDVVKYIFVCRRHGYDPEWEILDAAAQSLTKENNQ